MKEVIRLGNVIKLYGQRRAINGVSLRISENERVTIKGVPGSGKSTLLKLIAGMERPSAGEVYVLEKALHEMDADTLSAFRNRHIGVVLQDPCLIPELSVLENAALPLAARGVSVLKREKAAFDIIKAFGISHVAHTMPEKVSVYEAKAASLARAIVGQPEILLMEEAAACLSERETEKLRDIVSAMPGSGDYTILSFSAGEGEILKTDRRIVLDHGMIEEDKS